MFSPRGVLLFFHIIMANSILASTSSSSVPSAESPFAVVAPIPTPSSSEIGRCETIEELPETFTPGSFDVVCQRGKGSLRYPGNQLFRGIIEDSMTNYANTKSRREKTRIVLEIVDRIRSSTPYGGFVKREKNGRWSTVTYKMAREKVSQSLRDVLSSKYRSSTKAKKRQRIEKAANIDNELDQMIQSNNMVSQRIQRLNTEIEQQGSNLIDDGRVTQLFTNANIDLLEAMKRDSTMLQNFNNLTRTRQQSSASSESSVTAEDCFEDDESVPPPE